MKHNSKSQRGFTLIELLLYMGVFSMLLVMLFQLLTSIFDVQLESESTSSVSQDARYILNRITYDISQGDAITTPNVLGGQGEVLQISIGSITYTYSLTDGNLMLNNSVLGTTDQLNSVNTTVSNVNFLRLGDINNENDTVSVSFTLTSKTVKRGGPASGDFKTTVGTR